MTDETEIKKKKKNTPARKPTNINDEIIIHGARVHNLKNVTVEFPRNKLIVVTGVSGLLQKVYQS